MSALGLASALTYVWHYLLARLIYDELFRHGRALAVLFGIAFLAVAATIMTRRRRKRRRL